MGHLTQRDAIALITEDVGAHGAGVVVVAVDGHSAAGKSRFAATLSASLGGIVIAGDDFYRVMDPAVRAALDPESGASRYFDWERIRSDALEPLRAGRDARYQRYNWETNTLEPAPTLVPSATRVVVEGLFVSRAEFADLVDITVFVDAPVALRQRRQAERGDSPSWLDRWDAAELWYFRHARSPDSFDYVVSGT